MKLANIRKTQQINKNSNVNILAAEADLYMAQIDNKVVMKIGPKLDLGNLVPQDYTLATSGNQYAVWVK